MKYYRVWAIIKDDYKSFTTDYLNFIQLARDPNIFILKFEQLI